MQWFSNFSGVVFKFELVPKSPGGLVKRDCQAPPPELLMQDVWGGSEKLHFQQVPR